MLIGIDASKIALKTKTGIDNTASQLILALKKIDHTNSYNLYTNQALDKKYLSKNFKEKLIPFPRFWNKFRLPLSLIKNKPDIFIALTSSIPPISGKKNIALVHDLAYKYFPEAYSKYELLRQENALTVAVKKADRIVVTLNSNKKDLIKFHPKTESKIRIMPLSYNIEDRQETIAQSIKNKKPYFISVGRLEKRKNTSMLIKAFDRFKSQQKNDFQLVLVGKPGFGHSEIINTYNNAKHKKDIVIMGYINNKNLETLYKNSVALIFPSIYEGFGLPILEAFFYNTPVAASAIPATKEVAKNAVTYFDPNKIEEITKSMTMLADNLELRIDLIKKGTERLKKFSWEKSATILYNIIKELS